MTTFWKQIAGLFRLKADRLGFTHAAMPSAHQWLVAFTNHLLRHSEVEHGAQALMSGLRFYTPDFVAQLGIRPAAGSRHHGVPRNIAQAVYASTGPIIVDVYHRRISRGAGRAEIQAAFTQAMPELIGHWSRPMGRRV